MKQINSITALAAMALAAIAIAAFVTGPGTANAQDRLPVREYTNPQEQVVLDRSMPFREAISIIEELSEEFRGKIIVERSGFTGPIGIDIPRMHWLDALERIASFNSLRVMEQERYIEIEADIERQAEVAVDTEKEVEEERITFGTREVEIKATFFDVSRATIRDLGIDWSTLDNNRVQVDHIAAARVTDEALRVQFNWDDIANTGWDITAMFRALESSNLGEVISSPTIKVMEGESGRIQVGQDFSIRQRDFAGNVIDRFFSTGTILEVTPEIFYHQGIPFIHMSIRAERSTAAPGAISTVVNKQEAETEVLMLSGESTIMAGLYETDETKVRQGVPFLKDLPWWFFGLRYVFGYNLTSYSVNELVVLLEVNLVPTLQERMDRRYKNVPELIDEMRESFQKLN